MKFHIRLIPLVATILLCVLGIVLGQWQSRRANEKERTKELIMVQANLPPVSFDVTANAKDMMFRKVSIQGEFIADWPIYLDNRSLHGVAGFYVLMPFHLKDSDVYIMVVRGWLPRNPNNRLELPKLLTPHGQIHLIGRVRASLDRVLQLGKPAELSRAVIVQNLDIDSMRKKTQLKFTDFFIEQISEEPDNLRRDWSQAGTGSEKHRAYAFQWYVLSVMAFIFFVVTGFHRGKN
jgi:cytochrome oxidase assembly protein ShyY1